MVSHTSRFDYEKLLAAYQQNLTTVLRGFRPAEECLETWVPDPDHAKSILNLVEAARDADLDGVSVRIGNSVLSQIDMSRLEGLVHVLGAVSTVAVPGGVELEVRFSHA